MELNFSKKKTRVNFARNCVCRYLSLSFTLVDKGHLLVLQCFKSLPCRAYLMHDPTKSAKGYIRYSVARRRLAAVRFLFRASNVVVQYGCTSPMYHSSQFTLYDQPGINCFYVFLKYIARLFFLSRTQDRNF